MYIYIYNQKNQNILRQNVYIFLVLRLESLEKNL